MKNRILTLAGILALVAVLGKFYAVPAIAQAVRAAVVKNIDEPGRSPFQQEAFFSGSCPNIAACSVNYAPVPANKRLVITNVSGRFLTTGSNGRVDQVDLITGPILNRTFFLASIQNSSAGGSAWVVSQQIHAFVEAGTTPVIEVFGIGTGALYFTITGYFVDVTQ